METFLICFFFIYKKYIKGNDPVDESKNNLKVDLLKYLFEASKNDKSKSILRNAGFRDQLNNYLGNLIPKIISQDGETEDKPSNLNKEKKPAASAAYKNERRHIYLG